MRHRKNNSTSTTSYHIRRMSRNQNEVANTPPVAGHRRRSSQKVTPAPAGRVRRFSQQATPAPAGHGQRFSQQASSAQPKQQSRQQGTAAVSGHNRAFSQQLTPSATAFVPQSLLQDTPPAGSSQEPTQQTSPEASSG